MSEEKKNQQKRAFLRAREKKTITMTPCLCVCVCICVRGRALESEIKTARLDEFVSREEKKAE